MYVERYGSGPRNFLCLHGWSGDHCTFEPFVPEVHEAASLWCPDLPGCGRSAPPLDWTLESVVGEIAGFAVRLAGPLQVIGNCSGALLGLLLAEHVPVARIVMIDAFAYWPLYFRIFLSKGWGRYAYLTTFANPFGRWLANQSLARHRTDKTDLTAGFNKVDHEVTYRYLEMLGQIQSVDRFRGIELAVDVVYGERSFRAVRHSTLSWKRIFPCACLHELKGAGHLPILEATRQLEGIIFAS